MAERGELIRYPLPSHDLELKVYNAADFSMDDMVKHNAKTAMYETFTGDVQDLTISRDLRDVLYGASKR